MSKKYLRQQIIADLKHQDPHQKRDIEANLLEQFLASEDYKTAHTLATYLPFDFEYNTQPLIQQAQKDGKVLLIPKTYPKGIMVFTPYNPKTLHKTKFGLWESRETKTVDKDLIDLIHVPGLGFNAKGFRIGFGGGYYDRYLADFPNATISTAFPCQEINFQANPHDIPVRKVLTYAK